MRSSTVQQYFTCFILVVLLIARFPLADFLINFTRLANFQFPNFWVDHLRLIQGWTYYLWENISFILVGIVIVVNRKELPKINIDGGFIGIFLAASLVYWKYFRWPTGWFALLVIGVILFLYMRKDFVITEIEPITAKLIVILTIVLLLTLWLWNDSLTTSKIFSITHLVATEAPFILVEEFAFRGLLWTFLSSRNVSQSKILGIQAFIFWLSHIYNISTDPVFFWILVPISGLVLGGLVWISKSTTSSFVGHIFLNFVLRLR